MFFLNKARAKQCWINISLIPVSFYMFQDDSGVIENEWRFAAMVLDRVCLIAFTFFTVLLSAAVLIAAPHVIVFWAEQERKTKLQLYYIEIINNKARHNLIDAKCRWRSDRLYGAGSFREPLGQTKVMQIRQGETLNHQRAITHEFCCLSAQ